VPALPITFIVPAYNCAGNFSRHVEAIAPLLRLCQQTLFVVSPSPDDTQDRASQLAALHQATALITPAGLFNSWNAGARAATAEYCYFSTIGDTIDESGLKHLLAMAEGTAADLVITPPLMTDNNRRTIRDWPVVKRKKSWRKYEGRLIPIPDLISLVYQHAPDCIIGSSASALYRRSFLVRHPFPVTFYNYGDTAWTFKVCTSAAVAYSGQAVAHFVVHHATRHAPDENGMVRLQSLCLISARKQLRDPVKRNLRPQYRILPHKKRQAYKKWLHCREQLNERRGKHPRAFWWLNPGIWRLRLNRDRQSLLLQIILFLQINIIKRLTV